MFKHSNSVLYHIVCDCMHAAFEVLTCYHCVRYFHHFVVFNCKKFTISCYANFNVVARTHESNTCIQLHWNIQCDAWSVDIVYPDWPASVESASPLLLWNNTLDQYTIIQACFATVRLKQFLNCYEATVWPGDEARDRVLQVTCPVTTSNRHWHVFVLLQQNLIWHKG